MIITSNNLAKEGEHLCEIVRRHVEEYFQNHEGELPTGVYAQLLPLIEKPLIEATLKATAGNQIKAARVLGLNRNTLRKKIVELGIDAPRKRSGKT